MKGKYTFDNLSDNPELHEPFLRDYQKLIDGLKGLGFKAIALKHAQNKKRIEGALALF